jgi:hypothetical protein
LQRDFPDISNLAAACALAAQRYTGRKKYKGPGLSSYEKKHTLAQIHGLFKSNQPVWTHTLPPWSPLVVWCPNLGWHSVWWITSGFVGG